MIKLTGQRGRNEKPLYEAIIDAQKLAFAPLSFHAALALRDLGILQTLADILRGICGKVLVIFVDLARDQRVPRDVRGQQPGVDDGVAGEPEERAREQRIDRLGEPHRPGQQEAEERDGDRQRRQEPHQVRGDRDEGEKGNPLPAVVAPPRPQDAETEMRGLVAAYPGDATAALELVQFIGTQKGPDAARHELAGLIEANSDTVDFQLAMARLDFAQSRAEAAVERLQEVVSRGEPIEDVQRARLLLAELMLQDDQAEAASGLVADILAADEKNADALALRARLRMRSGDYESATADLRQALDVEPRSVRLLQMMAKVFERQGLTDLADDNYVQAVRAANYAPAVALDYTNFLSGRGDLARADAILSESLSRVPNNTDVLAALGQVRLRQQDWIGAQEVAELLRTLDDRSGLSDQILGTALLGQNEFDRSIELLKAAYSETPQAVRPLYTLVTAYVRAGQAAEAQDFLESVLTASPDNADAHVLLGSLHAMKDEPDAAVAAYRAAIDRRPDSPVGYRALAGHLISSGSIEEAESVILDGRRHAPGDLGLGLLHAGAQELKSNDEGALAVYEELLDKQPDSLILINNVASLIAEHRADEASLERAHQLALRLRDVDLAPFKDTLGWVHFRRGEFRAAVDYLESAAEGLPEHPLVRYHLGRAYAALERLDDAMAQLTTAAELVGEDDPLGEKIEQALGEVTKSQTLN